MAVSSERLQGRNERLRAAVLDSGLSAEQVAEQAGVDPKTLDRWMAGRVPHPRNRQALATVLGVHASDLWPETDPFDRLLPKDLAGVQGVYASRSVFLAKFSPEDLFAGATTIGLAGLTNNLLCQQFADHRLEQLLCLGTNVSCLFLDPDGQATAAREVEEGHEPGHLAGLTRMNISLLQRLRKRLPQGARDRLFLAKYDQTIRFNIIIAERPDETIAVVQAYLPHSRGVDSPTLVVHPIAEGGLFDTFQQIYNELKIQAVSC